MISLLKEFLEFLIEYKKFYLIPIGILLILISFILIFAKGSVLAPFIYTIF